jgi:hypothetical protein
VNLHPTEKHSIYKNEVLGAKKGSCKLKIMKL